VGEAAQALSQLLTMLPSELIIPAQQASNAPTEVIHPLLRDCLEFSSVMVADLVYDHVFLESDKSKWERSFGAYIVSWLPKDSSETAGSLADRARKHFHQAYLAQFAPSSTDDSGEELLCDTLFSLAYGALLLLSHTTLRLVRGKRYGILGPNGSGKSTLMRSLNAGKVENFPPQEVLRTVMVEHSLQGEDGSLSVIDFIASGKVLLNECLYFAYIFI